jgi:hypothetical protein
MAKRSHWAQEFTRPTRAAGSGGPESSTFYQRDAPGRETSKVAYAAIDPQAAFNELVREVQVTEFIGDVARFLVRNATHPECSLFSGARLIASGK